MPYLYKYGENMMTRIKGIQAMKYSSGIGTSVYGNLDSATHSFTVLPKMKEIFLSYFLSGNLFIVG